MNTPTMCPNITFVHRLLPHYRVPLFEALAKQAKITVFTASNLPKSAAKSGLKTQIEQPAWQKSLPFWFPFKRKEYWCHAPLKKLLKNKPDVLILEAGNTMTSSWLLPLWRQCGGLKNIKIILWGHGAPVTHHSGLKGNIVRALRRWQLKNTDGFLAYTAHDAQFLENLNTPTPIGFTSNTVDITPALALRKPRKTTQGDPFNLLAVGRMMPDKKMPELVVLVEKLQSRFPHLTLTIIGNGIDMQKCQKAAGSTLGKTIFLKGAVFGEERLAEAFKKADLFPLLGAAGLGVNHALAYGLPVLAFSPEAKGSEAPHHHPEIAYVKEGETGFLVKKGSLEAFEEALVGILENTMRPRDILGEKLWNYAPKNLRIETMAENILNFVNSLKRT